MCSGGSACLPSMWPQFGSCSVPYLGWVCSWFSPCSEGFSPGSPSPSPFVCCLGLTLCWVYCCKQMFLPRKAFLFHTRVHTVSVHTLVDEFTSLPWFDLRNSILMAEFYWDPCLLCIWKSAACDRKSNLSSQSETEHGCPYSYVVTLEFFGSSPWCALAREEMTARLVRDVFMLIPGLLK